MKGKKYLILGIIVTLVVLFLLFGFTKPSEEMQRAEQKNSINPILDFAVSEEKISIEDSYSFNFEGYGPGKSHIGTFNDIEGNYIKSDGELEYLELRIMVDSVNTGIDGLDSHLKAEDFFDLENYKNVVFISKEITKDSITGDLTMKGITKEITFEMFDNGESIASNFLLNIRDFGISNAGINDEVRLEFSINY